MDRDYSDIINMPHHVSEKRTRMSPADRAAQFSPFAALTGFESRIGEAARLTQEKIELDENRKAEINDILRYINEQPADRGSVAITYFVPDEKKAGGSYKTVTGRVKRIDPIEGYVSLKDGSLILIENIYAIDNDEYTE